MHNEDKPQTIQGIKDSISVINVETKDDTKNNFQILKRVHTSIIARLTAAYRCTAFNKLELFCPTPLPPMIEQG